MPQNGDFFTFVSNLNWRWQSAGPSGDVDLESSHHSKDGKVNDLHFNREVLFYLLILFGDKYIYIYKSDR